MNYMAAQCTILHFQTLLSDQAPTDNVIKKYFKRENSLAVFKVFFCKNLLAFFVKNCCFFFKMTPKRPYFTNKFLPFLSKNMSTGTKAAITIF